MNARQAFQKIERAVVFLTWGRVLNNVLGTLSIGVLIYLIWWQWHLGLLGFFVLLFGIWIVNSVFLPALFRLLNEPSAQMAKTGVVRLAVLKVISEDTVTQLADTSVEYWPRVIVSSMTKEQFQKKIAASVVD